MNPSQPSSSPPEPVADAAIAPPPQRKRAGVPGQWHARLQLLLAGVVFLMVNALSCQRFMIHDSTRNHVSTLSETTLQVTAAIDGPTRIVVAFVNDSGLKEKTWRLAQAYADARPGLIRARLLDPVRDPEGAHELAKRHHVEFKNNTVLVIKGKRVEIIPDTALDIIRKGQDGVTRTVGYAGENAITTAMLRLLEPTPPVIYLISGKGPWPVTPNGNGSDTLRTLLPNHNATLKELSLDGLDAIPEDAAAVMLVNPRYDLSGKEVRLLREFWEQRKGGICVMLNPENSTPNLDAFLKFHGITPDRRTVMKLANGPVGSSIELAVSVRFLPGAALTDPFVNADAKLPGTSISLQVDSNRDELRVRGIRPFILAESLPGYWGENSPAGAKPVFNRGEDAEGPLAVVAAVERAAVDDDRVKLPAARMVVFANPHLLDPDALAQVNVDFFFSALNWLMDRQTMIGANPRQPLYFQATMTDRHSRALHVLLLAVMPMFALFLSWLVHQRRRS